MTVPEDNDTILQIPNSVAIGLACLLAAIIAFVAIKVTKGADTVNKTQADTVATFGD